LNKLAFLLSKVANNEKLSPLERDELINLCDQLQAGATFANSISGGPSTIEGISVITGSGNVVSDETGLKIYNDDILTGWWQTDGDFVTGSNALSASTTSLAIFTNNQTYNSESVGAGDVLFGDNSINKANMLWDASSGQLLFRGGTTTQAYVDTAGRIIAGGGVVTIDAGGIRILLSDAASYVRSYAFESASAYLGFLGGYYTAVEEENHIVLSTSALSTYDEFVDVIARCASGRYSHCTLEAYDHMDKATAVHRAHVMAYATSSSSGIQLYAKNDATIKIGAFTSSGFQLNTGGQVIDEFSTDTTLSGNSDTALPTEKVVKTYADTKQTADATLTALAGLTTSANKIPYFTGEDTADVAAAGMYVPGSSLSNIYYVNNSSSTPFVGKINGSPTATSVVYDTDTNENSLNLTFVSMADTKVLLHNLTRGNYRYLSGVNVATNTITTVSSEDDWEDNDDITTDSQTVAHPYGGFIDLDVSEYINSTTTGIAFQAQVKELADGFYYMQFHPYETWSAAKEISLATPAIATGAYDYLMYIVPVIDGKICIRISASGAATFSTRLKYIGRIGVN
jgi:hypothetical protein